MASWYSTSFALLPARVKSCLGLDQNIIIKMAIFTQYYLPLFLFKENVKSHYQ